MIESTPSPGWRQAPRGGAKKLGAARRFLESPRRKVVVLATGGTIAGLAAPEGDDVSYVAGQVEVRQLLAGVPIAAGFDAEVEAEQLAQVDSKDMDHDVWQRLLVRCLHHLHDPGVAGIVITHGTDTMEETAFFLRAVLGGAGELDRPVVLTGAMRPASSLSADGPRNLSDALVAAGARQRLPPGVFVVFAGVVHGAEHVRKVHPYRLDAFDSAQAGPLGFVEEGRLRMLHARDTEARAWGGLECGLLEPALGRRLCETTAPHWPRVEIVNSHAGVSGAVVDALMSESGGAPELRGLVVAATGNGSLHERLQEALLRALARGIRVVRASRCGMGGILPTAHDVLPDAGSLPPVKARIALMLALAAQDAQQR